MDRSNFWSMQLFQTEPHFKLEEVWFCEGIFRLDITARRTRMFGAVGN